MADVQVGHFRGQNGVVYPMSLPLPPPMQKQLTKGYLVRVNADGSEYREPAPAQPADTGNGDGDPPAPAQPADTALKAEWVGHAVRVGGITPDEAEAMTKADLIDRFGRKPE